MNILAIETSTKYGGVALLESEELVSELILNSKLSHSERISKSINDILIYSKLSPKEIDYIAVSIGPGSFTGLRIGLACAKGLAFSLKKPIISVPSLKALALNISHTDYSICPLIDAKKNDVFSASFKYKKGILANTKKEQSINISDLLSGINEKTIFIGDGASLHSHEIRKKMGKKCEIINNKYSFPRPRNIGFLALDLIKKKKYIGCDKLDKLEPNYLQKSRAEMKII